MGAFGPYRVCDEMAYPTQPRVRPPFYQRFPQLTSPSATGRFASAVSETEGSGYVALWLAILEEPAALTPKQWVTQQRVRIDGDQVLEGQVAVAAVIVDAALAHNPTLVAEAWARWEAEKSASDDDEGDWRRHYDQELQANATIAFDLERSREQLLKRAGLDEKHRQVMRLYLEEHPTRQIAALMLTSQSNVRRWLDEARTALQGLRRDRTLTVAV